MNTILAVIELRLLPCVILTNIHDKATRPTSSWNPRVFNAKAASSLILDEHLFHKHPPEPSHASRKKYLRHKTSACLITAILISDFHCPFYQGFPSIASPRVGRSLHHCRSGRRGQVLCLFFVMPSPTLLVLALGAATVAFAAKIRKLLKKYTWKMYILIFWRARPKSKFVICSKMG